MCVAVGNSGQVATNKASIFSRLLSYLLKRGIGNVIRHIQVLRRMPLRRAEAGVDVLNKILHSIARLNNAFWLDKISHVGNLKHPIRVFHFIMVMQHQIVFHNIGSKLFLWKVIDLWLLRWEGSCRCLSNGKRIYVKHCFQFMIESGMKKLLKAFPTQYLGTPCILEKSKINFFKTFTGGGI